MSQTTNIAAASKATLPVICQGFTKFSEGQERISEGKLARTGMPRSTAVRLTRRVSAAGPPCAIIARVTIGSMYAEFAASEARGVTLAWVRGHGQAMAWFA
ncbi:hypothetical protein AB0F72_41065 [Actinoplanes sp. NPDC023936]|uniref:hypothetical protein n=1 Tax=Actinoplanes sp. NPDC023936 TaxID=3154910 RepID=UPI00340205F1